MSYLVLGSTVVHVASGGASKKTPERIGSSTRSFAGNLRSTVRAEKRNWQFTTKLLTDTDAATIEALVTGGVFVTCSGDLLGGTVSCEITVGDDPYVQVKGGFKRALQLQLKEV